MSLILIDYDLNTWEIRRIIHPDNDSQINNHKLESGWGRVTAASANFPIDQVSGKPKYSLSACIDEVQRQTGIRPKNIL